MNRFYDVLAFLIVATAIPVLFTAGGVLLSQLLQAPV